MRQNLFVVAAIAAIGFLSACETATPVRVDTAEAQLIPTASAEEYLGSLYTHIEIAKNNNLSYAYCRFTNGQIVSQELRFNWLGNFNGMGREKVFSYDEVYYSLVDEQMITDTYRNFSIVRKGYSNETLSLGGAYGDRCLIVPESKNNAIQSWENLRVFERGVAALVSLGIDRHPND